MGSNSPTMNSLRASILIPVKNGGALLGDVLDAVLAQQAPWAYEVIVVDSGSSDGSVELARQRGVRVETITPAEFGHGRTRNLLASMARGEFLIFITQDARPASPHWLRHMVQACDAAPDVAGAFGPHRAHPEARWVTQRELDQHFAGFGSDQSVVRLEDRERFARDPGYRQWLHFFSSNNACIRRSVWERIPLPEVAFAEDQTWALRIIEAGYGKAFAPQATVFHSHDFGVWETLQRNFDEARSFQRYFGYRVQPGMLRALASGALLARRDAAWLREQPGLKGLAYLRQAFAMGLIEYARVIGQYLGTWHERLPRFVLRSVSRDERLQRAGAH